WRKLFNTSGLDYKAMNLKERLAGMTQAEALKLLRGNGRLVKRPFVITRDSGWVGFDESEWKRRLAEG
ncbi:MAG: arsenate reductase family protein, partial [Verrucomicrobia bacterium]|nr:arsenate reductase family protein [Verrucomicrobiota bacterium]